LLISTISILLALSLPASTASSGAVPIDRSFALDPIWDDGLAEVAHYDAHRKVYGIDRVFRTTMITVKEEFDATTAVKADPPYTGRPIVTVLKLNILSVIPTENYPYSYMTSIFARRDDLRVLVKAASSSQEWCGTTFKEVITWEGSPRLRFHSYFDTQADGEHAMALPEGTMLEDQLYLAMRAVVPEPGMSASLPVYDSLISNSVPRAPVARPMTLVSGRDESVSTPAGSFATHRYDLIETGSTAPAMSFWIENGRRRALVKFSAADGRSLLLAEITRRDYWSR